MKALIKSLLANTILRHAWNRFLGGNNIRTSGAGNKMQLGKSLLTRTRIQIQGVGNTLVVGNGCRLHDLKIIMTGDSLRVEISDNCQLRGKIKLEDAGSQITVGAGSTLENAYLGAYEGTKIHIGKDCMISDQVGLRTGDMHSIMEAETKVRLNPARDIIIEPHVWLCRGVTVLKGCTVGTHTVVGGFSVVTSSLPANVLAVGLPAKIVQDKITWQRERIEIDR